MKKLLIALLLFAVSAQADDYCDTYAGYAAETKRRFFVKQSVTAEPWSDTTLNQYTRSAVIHHCGFMRGPSHVLKFVTTADNDVYTIDSFFVKIQSVKWSKNDSTKSFLPVPMEQWYANKITPLAGKVAYDFRPSYYDWSDSLLWLYPTPDGAGDTIVVAGWRKVPTIASGSAVDSLAVIPQEYRPLIVDYVAWQIAISISSPMVQFYQAIYERKRADLGMSEVKQ